MSLEFKQEIMKRKEFFYLGLLLAGCLSIRFYYFPYEIPLVVDAVDHFFYATEIVMLESLPKNWMPINNGWPIFLSFWFLIFRLEDTEQYMGLQRILTIIFSSLTVVPIYFICKNFVEAKYAIFGSILFGLDPRIILNSLIGSTDPLYIFLGAMSFAFLLRNKKYDIYLAFIFASLSTIIRGEGVFFFLAIIIIFFIRNKISYELIKKFIPSLVMFFIILLPILLYRIEVTGSDGVFLRASSAALETSIISNINGFQNIFSGIELFIKFFGWVLIPNFLFFVPIGFILFLKNKIRENFFIVIFLIMMSISPLYAYTVDAQDTRYLYFLFPIFSLLSAFAIKKYLNKTKLKNYFLLSIIFGIIVSSIFFYEYKKEDWRFDNKIEIENIKIAEKIISISNGVNLHPIESRYIISLQIPSDWPFLHNEIEYKTKSIPWKDSKSLKGFINQNKKELTHLVVDDDNRLPVFLKDVYHNEEEYGYLKNVFDSKNEGFNQEMKIFEIDFQKFDSKYK